MPDGSNVALSEFLKGRVVALSRSLKPYRYLDDQGTLTEEAFSPERGQLLVSLLHSGVDLGSLLSLADFSCADLTSASLAGADLSIGTETDEHTALRESVQDLKDAVQALNDGRRSPPSEGVNLEYARLVEATLSDAKLDRARFYGADLTFSDLRRACVSHVEFSHAVLDCADLREAIDMETTKMTDARLRGAWLCGSEMPNLYGTVLQDACLYKASFRGRRVIADLTRAYLEDADFTEADLSDTRSWMRRRVTGPGAVLRNASLRNATLRAADLEGADLEGAFLWGADLRDAILSETKGLRQVKSLSGANIWGIKKAPSWFRSWALEKGALEAENDRDWDLLKEEQLKARADMKSWSLTAQRAEEGLKAEATHQGVHHWTRGQGEAK